MTNHDPSISQESQLIKDELYMTEQLICALTTRNDHSTWTKEDHMDDLLPPEFMQQLTTMVSETRAILEKKMLEVHVKNFMATLQLAHHGDAVAQHSIGLMYQQGIGVPQDDAEALKWFRLASRQGYTKARNQLDTLSQ